MYTRVCFCQQSHWGSLKCLASFLVCKRKKQEKNDRYTVVLIDVPVSFAYYNMPEEGWYFSSAIKNICVNCISWILQSLKTFSKPCVMDPLIFLRVHSGHSMFPDNSAWYFISRAINHVTTCTKDYVCLSWIIGIGWGWMDLAQEKLSMFWSLASWIWVLYCSFSPVQIIY